MSEQLLSESNEQDPVDARLDARISAWTEAFKPSDAYQEYLVKEYAECTLEKEQIKAQLKTTRAKWARQMELDWDAYQRLEVAKLGNQLKKNPGVIREKLLLSFHGCAWMIDCWTRLLAKWERFRTFTSGELTLAYDLLGIPVELRGYVEDFHVEHDLTAKMKAEIDALKDRKASRVGINQIERRAAVSGQGMLLDKVEEIVHLNKQLESAIKQEHRLTSWLTSARRDSQRDGMAAESQATNDVKTGYLPSSIDTITSSIDTTESCCAEADPLIEIETLQSEPLNEIEPVPSEPLSSQSVEVGPALADAIQPEARNISFAHNVEFRRPTLDQAAVYQRVVDNSAEAKWVGHSRPQAN